MMLLMYHSFVLVLEHVLFNKNNLFIKLINKNLLDFLTTELFDIADDEGICWVSYLAKYVVNDGTSFRTPGNESFSVSFKSACK